MKLWAKLDFGFNYAAGFVRAKGITRVVAPDELLSKDLSALFIYLPKLRYRIKKLDLRQEWNYLCTTKINSCPENK